MLSAYIPIAIFVVVATGFALFTLVFSSLIHSEKYNKVKLEPYECGIEPTTDARDRYSIRYYLVAMLFVIFDVETVFMFPWAVIFDKLLLFGLIEMMVFIFILVVGYYYAWQKGALEWVYRWLTNPRATDAADAAADKPARRAEPLKAEVSRTDAGAGVSLHRLRRAAPAKPANRRRRGCDAARPAPPRNRPRLRRRSRPRPAAAQAGAEHPPPAAPPRTARSAAARRQDAAGVHRHAAGRVPDSVTQVSYWVGDWTIIVPVAQILEVARHLRDAPDAAFDFCSDVTATDGRRGRSASTSSTVCTRRAIAIASA